MYNTFGVFDATHYDAFIKLQMLLDINKHQCT